MVTFLRFFVVFSILVYQGFGRCFFPKSCRYIMSCSDFTLWAINTFGLFSGLRMGRQRLLSCHPLSWY